MVERGDPARKVRGVVTAKIKNERFGMAKDAPGMRGIRSRDENGPLRKKREDTHMGKVEHEYGRDFGVRSDMHLGEYLEQQGLGSLHQLVHSNLGKK